MLHRIVAQLDGMEAIDVCCDADVLPFYEKQGFWTFSGAGQRSPDALR